MKPTLNILIIEDSADDAALLLMHLRQTGFIVNHSVIETAQDLSTELARQSWDIIISDFNLPQFSGLKALEMVKASGLDIPFILVSGAMGEETAVEAMRAGAHDYVIKDRLGRLIPAIERELRDAEGRVAQRKAEEEKRQLEIELQKAKELAELANRRKSQVLAFVAHEFKTPLVAITMFAEFLEKNMEGELNEAQRGFVLNILSGVQHLKDLINDILDISSIEAGKITLLARQVPIAPLMDEVRSLTQDLALKNEIALEFDLDPELHELYAEPKRVRQILINLLSNAVKYNKPGGKVLCRCYRSECGKSVVCDVTDNGLGMTEEELARLFTEYYRVKNSFAPQKEGLGLGLALTKKLVELHGGVMTVNSKPGEGSTFSFTLPLQIKPALAAETQQTQA